jgi:hypothetical protein
MSDPISATPQGRPLTDHAKDSLRRHGFKEPFDQVDEIVDQATRVTTQADGATVYIQRAGTRSKRYNVIIEGVEGIVTGLRNLTKHELENLGKNYGFQPNP